MCPLQSAAKGNFWGDTVDYDIHEVQSPAASEVRSTPVTSGSVSTNATDKDKRVLKNI